MRRQVILSLLYSCILCAGSFAQPTAHEASPADVAEYERVVGSAKNLPAHKLDRRLPALAFGDWLQAEVGSHTRITWALWRPSTREHPEFVEVGVHANDGRNLIINVAMGPTVRRPHVLSVVLRRSDYEGSDVRMRDVPSILREFKQEPDHPQ
jgi:hypothetical protein